MRFFLVFSHYLKWHYTRALRDLTRIYRNFIVFVFNFFSVPVLVRSYFAPWRRLGEEYPPTMIIDPFNYFSVFLVNLIMRLVGVIMRTIVIVLGMTMTLLLVFSYPLVLFLWLILPLIIVIIFLIGLGLLFK